MEGRARRVVAIVDDNRILIRLLQEPLLQLVGHSTSLDAIFSYLKGVGMDSLVVADSCLGEWNLELALRCLSQLLPAVTVVLLLRQTGCPVPGDGVADGMAIFREPFDVEAIVSCLWRGSGPERTLVLPKRTVDPGACPPAGRNAGRANGAFAGEVAARLSAAGNQGTPQAVLDGAVREQFLTCDAGAGSVVSNLRDKPAQVLHPPWCGTDPVRDGFQYEGGEQQSVPVREGQSLWREMLKSHLATPQQQFPAAGSPGADAFSSLVMPGPDPSDHSVSGPSGGWVGRLRGGRQFHGTGAAETVFTPEAAPGAWMPSSHSSSLVVGAGVLPPQVVSVFSPKGGVGKTFVAANLAVTLAERTPWRVALADLDLAAGDVAVHLDLMEGPTIADALPFLREPHPEDLGRFITRHRPSTLDVLLAPSRPELADLVKTEQVRRILELLKKNYHAVVVDTPSDRGNDLLYECLELSGYAVLVVSADAACLRQARLVLDVLRKLAIPAGEKFLVVVNQWNGNGPVSLERLQSFLETKVSLVIEDDRQAVEASIFEGRPLVQHQKGHPIAASFVHLAGLFYPVLYQARKAKDGTSHNPLTWWRRRRKK